jgi:hypothetical protein
MLRLHRVLFFYITMMMILLSSIISMMVVSANVRIHLSTHQLASKKNCTLGDFTLSHLSLHYYQKNLYIACNDGQASCYAIRREHEPAEAVACPEKDLASKIQTEKRRRNQENRRLSLVVAESHRIWESGVACYAFNPQSPFSESQRAFVLEAMKTYERSTNVRFMPIATCKAENMTQYCKGCASFIDFRRPSFGRDCNSSIGVNSQGPQVMNLADRCFEADNELKSETGTPMHEIAHALGLYHEHQHPGRAIAVFWDEIPPNIWAEMKVRDIALGGKYDPDSIMHYPSKYGFCYPKICEAGSTTNCVPAGSSFCGLNEDPQSGCLKPSREICDQARTDAIGQRRFLSPGDLEALREIYKQAEWEASTSMIAE